MGSKMEGWTVRREEVERKNGEGGRRGGLVERGGGVSEREREGVSGRDGASGGRVCSVGVGGH